MKQKNKNLKVKKNFFGHFLETTSESNVKKLPIKNPR